MAFIESLPFPHHLAFGSTGGPGFKTSVVATRGGQEQRNQHWQHTLRRWDVGLVNKSLAESQALLAFFNGVAVGRTNAFRFRDFLPGESTAVQSLVGFGTGVSQDIQLRKTYRAGSSVYRRPITAPVAGTVQLFVDDVETTSFTVDTATGVLTTTQGVGTVLRTSCTYDVPARFDVDIIAMQQVGMDLYSWPSIPVQEVRFPALEDPELDAFEEPDPADPPAPVLDDITTLLDTTLSQGIPHLYWSAPAPWPVPLVAYDLLRRPADVPPETPFEIVATVAPIVLNWRDSTLELMNVLLVLLSEAGFEYCVEAIYADESTARSNIMSVNAPIDFVITDSGSFNSSIVYGALDFGQVPIFALPNAIPDFATLIPLLLVDTSMNGTHMTALVDQFSEGGGTHIFSIRDTRGRLSINTSWVLFWNDGVA